ncbi:MAG: ATP-binding protein, partial [Agathobacter sp.]|nr:ATP-binding protein [Agathobacter sp.]
MSILIGRKRECERLEKCMKATTAQLVVVYGRRRVGKTFLVNQYFKNKLEFKVTGAYGQPKEVQLRNFADELNRRSEKEWANPKDWIQAFNYLRNYIEELSDDEKHVFFIDEMPWLDTHKSGFLPAFEYFWNDYGSSKDNLVFVICGSATSWMMDNIANNKGGLFNRQTCRLYLEPFTLAQTKEYLLAQGMSWSEYDITECYMIMGGIPYYLSLLENDLSYVQNIDNLFFRKKAELWDEFEHLYRTLFVNSDKYVQVMECLSEKRSGYTRNEIAEKTGI